MTEKTEKATPIALNFSGTEKTFADIGELREFLQSQRDTWAWLEQAAGQDNELYQVWEPFNTYFSQANDFIETYGMYTDQRECQTGLINNFANLTKTKISQGFILTEATIGRFLSRLKDRESPQVAGYALALLNNVNVNQNNVTAYKGSYWAMQYIMGSRGSFPGSQQKIFESIIDGQITGQETVFESHITEHGKNFKNQIIEQENMFENQITKQVSVFENHISEHTENLKKQIIEQKNIFGDQINEQESVFEERTANHTNNFKEQITKQASFFEIMLNDAKKKLTDHICEILTLFEETEKRLTDFEASHKEKISLQGSVEYWSNKRKHHQDKVKRMAVFTIIIAVTVLFVFTFAAYYFLDVTMAEAQLLQIGIMLAISTIGIWLIRLSTKIFISNLHLQMDADERVIMFQTYFSLLAEGKGLNDGDRQLILQTLFRPSSTGFIKDDGPTTIPQSVANNVSNK